MVEKHINFSNVSFLLCNWSVRANFMAQFFFHSLAAKKPSQKHTLSKKLKKIVLYRLYFYVNEKFSFIPFGFVM